jgi:hypothetical protein
MARVRLDTARITDWPSFHAECQRALGFPAFYGANMNAWIDCLSDLREESAAGMASVSLAPDEILLLEVPDAEGFRLRAPEIVEGLWDCTSFVNRRYTDDGGLPAIALVPVDSALSGSAT